MSPRAPIPTTVPARSGPRLAARIAALAAGCVVLAAVAGGARAGEQTSIGNVDVVHGEGAITTNEATQTTLTSRGRVIYEWDGIHQPADHTLQFDQSGKNASALNRGVGQNPFEFFGTVKSNGQVVFANEAGVHFKGGSSIEVYSLIAGAASITNQEFLDDQIIFRGARGQVVNEGVIEAFDVALFGERVANHGDIYVEDGQLLMLAGDAVWIREHDSPIVIKVPMDGHAHGYSAETTSVENTGLIDAGEHGRVRLAAADGLAYAIRNKVVERIAQGGSDVPESGVIRAGTIEIVGGEGSGVEIGGTLDATRWGKNAEGGTIDVFGERIVIGDDAVVDATGSEGGGKIRIGGDLGGQGDAPRAGLVFVSESAEIHADADYAGDGGEVIVWSDGHAYVHGTITARGGEYAGDGGFVETSGKVYLDVTRPVDVRSRAHRAVDPGGTWLIDPYDITIGTFATTPEQCEADPTCLDKGIDLDDIFFVNSPVLYTPAPSSQLNASVVADALTNGSNITITTATGTSEVGTQGGTITIVSDILPGENADENTSVTLQLRAANSIEVLADIGGGDDPRYENLNLGVQLIANDNASQAELPVDDDQTPNSYIGNVLVFGDIKSNRSDVLLQGVDITLYEGATIETRGGDVVVAAIGSVDRRTGAPRGGGNASLLGDVDTSSGRTDERGDPLPGGTLTVRAQYASVPVDGNTEDPTQLGGNVYLEGAIDLGAHDPGTTALDVEAFGGDLSIGDLDDPTPITTGGGSVTLVSIRVNEDPQLSPGALETGGVVQMEPTASIVTEGGDVRIEAKGQLQGVDQSGDYDTLVSVRGQIDTRPVDDDQNDDGRVDTIGGDVVIRAEGDPDSNRPTGDVEIIDERVSMVALDDLIETGGGNVQVNFDADSTDDDVPDGNSLASVHVAASIDAGVRNGAELDADLEDAAFGTVLIDSAGSLVFENLDAPDGRAARTIRGRQVALRSANRSPLEGSLRGDLEFVSNGSNEGPQIWARDIELNAGTFSRLGFSETQSRIDAGDVVLAGIDGPGGDAVESLVFSQNAAIASADVLDPSTHFADGAGALDGLIYLIRSNTSGVTLQDPRKVAGTAYPGEPADREDYGALLEIWAEGGDDVVDAIVLGEDDGAGTTWGDANLQALDLTLNQGFTVDQTLAGFASAATEDLSITTGRRTLDRADLRIEDGVTLDAALRLVLHAADPIPLGAGGSEGDLLFGTETGGDGSVITLASRDIRLWAGSGGNALVDGRSIDNRVYATPDAGTRVEFDLGSLDPMDEDFRSFSLRQEAKITDDDIPDVDQFVGDLGATTDEIGLIDYELRSDAGEILLGWDGAQKIQRTNLRLLAREDPDDGVSGTSDPIEIDLGVDGLGDPRRLEVRTLDMGGTVDFEVTQQLIDSFTFASPSEDPGSSPETFTFRAGVTEDGQLTFASVDDDGDDVETVIRAREIRLVAGDGAGANDGSSILVDDLVRFEGSGPPGTPVETFVFRQDGRVEVQLDPDGIAAGLPDLDVNFSGVAPDVYAVQSDDGSIQITIDTVDEDGETVTFVDRPLPIANLRTILSAPAVRLARGDGVDLDLAHAFSADPGTTATQLEIRADSIELTATDERLAQRDSQTGELVPLPDDADLARVVFGEHDGMGNYLPDQGLYVYAFGDQDFDARDFAPVPEPLDVRVQDGLNQTIPELLIVTQDGTFESPSLLDLARSGSGCGFGRGQLSSPGVGCEEGERRRTGLLLTSALGDVHIRPDRVFGGRIGLTVPTTIYDDPQASQKSARFIFFDSDDGLANTPRSYFTESFEAITSYGWKVGAATAPVEIQAAGLLFLSAGASGEGDLTFHPNVRLQSEDIQILAEGPSGRRSSNILLPIVDARTNTPVFDFLQPDQYPDSIRVDTNNDRLTIEQDGWINSNRDREASAPPRTLPIAATQIVNAGLVDEGGGAPDELFGYTLVSNRRGVYIDDLPNVAASRLLVIANLNEFYDDDEDTVDRPGLIEIDHSAFTGDAASIGFAAAGISRAALIGDEIRFIAGDRGIVDASGDVFYASNSGSQAPPLAFLIEQEWSFWDNPSEQPDPTDPLTLLPAGFDFGSQNLPDFFQFTTGLLDVAYTLRLRESAIPDQKIQIGSDSADKLRGSALTLEALDLVQIDVPEVRREGIVLSSLDVREIDGDDLLSIELGGVFDTGLDTDPDLVATLIETSGDQTYDGLVLVYGNVELRGEDITFVDHVLNASIDPTEQSGLDFITRGTISFGGDVGCVVGAAGCSGVTGEGWATAGNATDFWFDRFRVRFDADDDAHDAVAFTGAFADGRGAQSVLAIDAQIYAISPSDDFDSLDSEVVEIPQVASIYKADSDVDDGETESLTFYTRDLFRVGEGQKVSVQGDFAAHSQSEIEIGDVAALTITLEVDPAQGTIGILRRPAGAYLTPDGRRLNDAGVGFVTNDLDLNVKPTLIDDGRGPVLAIEDPRTADDPDFEGFMLTGIDDEGGPLTLADFEWQFDDPPDALPALHAFGPPRNDISQAFSGAGVVPAPPPRMPAAWRVANARRLRDLSVEPRDRTEREWQRYLDGAGIIDDIGTNSPRRDGLQTVAQPRLLAQDAEASIELYVRIFGEDGVRAPAVRAILADALDRYRRSSGTRRVVGFEFRRYVKNRPSSLFDAYQVFEDLDALFDRHRALGLTPGEYRPIQAAWLTQIRPEGITVAELAEAVHPSRYVRGTDILEIFGD